MPHWKKKQKVKFSKNSSLGAIFIDFYRKKLLAQLDFLNL